MTAALFFIRQGHVSFHLSTECHLHFCFVFGSPNFLAILFYLFTFALPLFNFRFNYIAITGLCCVSLSRKSSHKFSPSKVNKLICFGKRSRYISLLGVHSPCTLV